MSQEDEQSSSTISSRANMNVVPVLITPIGVEAPVGFREDENVNLNTSRPGLDLLEFVRGQPAHVVMNHIEAIARGSSEWLWGDYEVHGIQAEAVESNEQESHYDEAIDPDTKQHQICMCD